MNRWICDTLIFDFFFKVWIITFLWLPLNDNDDLFVTGAHMPVFSQVSWGVILHYRASWIGITSFRPTPFNQVQLYSYWCASLLRHIVNHWNGDLEKKQTDRQREATSKTVDLSLTILIVLNTKVLEHTNTRRMTDI